MTSQLKKIKILSFILLSLSLQTAVITLFLPSRIQAVAPPLAPGCYRGTSVDYSSVRCDTENQQRAIEPPVNKCFVGGLQGPLSEVDCTNLQPTGTQVQEPSTIKSDCEGEDITAGVPPDDPRHCGILDYLVLGINLLSAIVGIVVVGSIIYGGILYSSAGSDPQKVKAAKDRIRNAIIALLAFIFTYSFLNYLVPGGVL